MSYTVGVLMSQIGRYLHQNVQNSFYPLLHSISVQNKHSPSCNGDRKLAQATKLKSTGPVANMKFSLFCTLNLYSKYTVSLAYFVTKIVFSFYIMVYWANRHIAPKRKEWMVYCLYAVSS